MIGRDDIEMTSQPLNDVDGDKGKGKEKESVGSSSNMMLTSHDDGYQELTLTSDAMMDESVLDDEEEWRAMSDNGESICSEEDEQDDDDGAAEMVIERPFEEEFSSAALLDLSHTETPLEDPHTVKLDPVSLDNILPEGSRRRRPDRFV